MLSGCSFPFFNGGSSHNTPTTTTTSTTSTSTSSTSSTSGSAECAKDSMAIKDGFRPQASAVAQDGIKDEGECCAACQRSNRCVVWSFQFGQDICHFTDKAHPFGGEDENNVLIEDQSSIMGVKRFDICDGCLENGWGECGRTPFTTDMSAWKECTKCDDPDNWHEYPCFLANGCQCGGDTSWPPPSEGPTTDAPDEEDSDDDDGWEAFVNDGHLAI
jgi:hypothetical protein